MNPKTERLILLRSVSGGYTISGNVGIGGASITFGSISTFSFSDGSYSLLGVPRGASGTLNVSLANYEFWPARQRIRAVTANLSLVNFTATYMSAGSYYVATTGDDTTGDGSIGNPWKTIQKALGTVPIAGRCYIKPADGTYAEDWGGALYCFRNYTNLVVITPQSGNLGGVIITGTGATSYSVKIENQKRLRFRKIAVGDNGTTSLNAVFIMGSTQYVDFIDCNITYTATQTNTNTGTVAVTNGSYINFDGCAFSISGTFTPGFVVRVLAAVNIAISNVLITNCSFPTINSSGLTSVFIVQATWHATTPGSVTNVEISNTVVSTALPTYIILTGKDDWTAQGDIVVSVLDCNWTGSNHVMFFGRGSLNCIADHNTVYGGIYCFIAKETVGVEARYNTFYGGSNSTVYVKAGVGTNAHHNTLILTAGAGLRVNKNVTSGNRPSNWNFQNNIVNVSGTGKAFDVGNDAEDAGGGVCDYNTYQNNSGLGVVRNDPDVQNLAELQAAWLDYSVTTNDAHSVVV